MRIARLSLGLIVIVSLFVLVAAGCGSAAPTATAVAPTATPQPTATPTPEPTATPTPQPTPTAKILNITMARGVDNEQKATDPTTVFGPMERVFASAELQDLAKDTKLTGKWFLDEDLLKTFELTADDDYDSVFVSFFLEPTEPLPAGDYHVEIYLDDELTAKAPFRIEEEPAAETTPVDGMALYEDPDFGFSISHPTEWQVTQETDGVTIQMPGALKMVMVRTIPEAALMAPQEISDSFFQGIAENAPDAQIVDETELEFAGMTWHAAGITYTNEEPQIPVAMAAYSTVYGDTAFVLVAIAPEETMNVDVDMYFNPMRDSFQFTQ
jgi:hypothetical protein